MINLLPTFSSNNTQNLQNFNQHQTPSLTPPPTTTTTTRISESSDTDVESIFTIGSIEFVDDNYFTNNNNNDDGNDIDLLEPVWSLGRRERLFLGGLDDVDEDETTVGNCDAGRGGGVGGDVGEGNIDRVGDAMVVEDGKLLRGGGGKSDNKRSSLLSKLSGKLGGNGSGHCRFGDSFHYEGRSSGGGS
ncbi:hypothetical protein HDU76_008295, partial [Blyttiomyces sp. JEL0837]